eukprot:209719_1
MLEAISKFSSGLNGLAWSAASCSAKCLLSVPLVGTGVSASSLAVLKSRQQNGTLGPLLEPILSAKTPASSLTVLKSREQDGVCERRLQQHPPAETPNEAVLPNANATTTKVQIILSCI